MKGRVNFFLALMFSVLSFARIASADITRNCFAGIDVSIIDEGPNWSRRLGNIVGQGSCNNVLQANTCRSRARQAVGECVQAMWQGRQVNAIPAACKNLVSGSSRSGAKLTYDGIMVINEPNRLSARTARLVCCQARPDSDKVKLFFSGVLTGDEKCAKHKVGNNQYQEEFDLGHYDMNCDSWRDAGICD
jgi:hypothetical protein